MSKHRLAYPLATASSLIFGCFALATVVLGAENANFMDSYPYPVGKTMLFSLYSLEEPELSHARADGLSAVGPHYGKPNLERSLQRSDAADLPMVFSVGRKIDFDSEPDLAAELEFLEKSVIEASQSDKVAIWAMRNEELRYWRKSEIEWLESAARVIRANDPAGRPIMMYEPNHREAPALVETSQYLDIIAKGAYANYVGMKLSRTWIKWSVEQAVDAAIQLQKTPVAILWMSRDQQTTADISNIPKWTRHDTYLSLISGAKGILVYSGWSKRKGFELHFDDFYRGYTSVAKELTGELNLGAVFLYGKKQNELGITIAGGPATQTFTYQKVTHTYPTVSSAQFSFEQRNYAFIVNSANEQVVIELAGLPSDSRAKDIFSGIPATKMLTLNAYDVKILVW